jgi:tetratricopeptide (TPR) repeat protein
VRLHRARTLAAALSLGLAGGGFAAPAPTAAGEMDRRIQVGEVVEDVELPTLEGGKAHFVQKGLAANVFVFFRPEQERSTDTLRDMAACEKEFAKRQVRWVGVVSDSWPAETVRALVKETGIQMPVLVDVGDALYGRLGIRLHPVIGMVDRKGRLAAFEPFRQINYCERIRVRIRLLLGEVTEADVARVDDPPPSPLPHSDQGVARRHVNFARRLHEIQQDAQALAELDKANAVSPSAAAWALRGRILAGQGKCPDAVRAFDEALKLDPGDAAARDGKKSCGK